MAYNVIWFYIYFNPNCVYSKYFQLCSFYSFTPLIHFVLKTVVSTQNTFIRPPPSVQRTIRFKYGVNVFLPSLKLLLVLFINCFVLFIYYRSLVFLLWVFKIDVFFQFCNQIGGDYNNRKTSWIPSQYMIEITLQSTVDWLSCWFIKADCTTTDTRQLQQDLTEFLGHIDANQFTFVILHQSDWYIYNFFQMMLLKTNKSIIVNYLGKNSLPQQHLQSISALVKQVDAMDLKIGFDLSMEQLAFLMLNIPGFINHLTRGGSIEDIDVDVVFQEFVQKYASIKLIVTSNEFTIE